MIILEGTDAVGKTSVINNLANYELVDRDRNICSLMNFNVSLKERTIKLSNYLEKSERFIIFLINNDKEELERRIKTRTKIDEFDKYAYLYNLLYLETYIYMEKNNLLKGRLFMIDCTGLTIGDEIKKVKEMVDSICQI